MQKILGMPLAIVSCFLIGLAVSLLPTLPVTLAAFFLAVGLTCLTYSYLGGQLDSTRSEGSGSLGPLSFKLTGSVVTFRVSFLFRNHHLGLSRTESDRNLSLESGLDDIKVEAGSQLLGSLRGNQLGDWARKLARDDYFHPALIAARRPYCEQDPAKCVSLAGFYAIAAANRKVQPGTIVLCQVDRPMSKHDEEYSEVSLALASAVTYRLLNQLEVQGESVDRSLSDALSMKARYAESGGFGNQCRRVPSLPSRGSPAIRIAALVNPADLALLHSQASDGKPRLLKLSFMAPD